MTELRRLAARTLLAAFVGPELPSWAKERLARGLGGICLFGGNVGDGAALGGLTAAIHAAGTDAIVTVDEEGGDVTRLFYGVGSPHAGHAVLGMVDDLDLTRRVAADIGRTLRAVDVDLDLGPVADVNSDPLNPVIGVRSFGADPQLVARHTAAWVQGLQHTGVGACLKHFPGHGDTRTDSHVDLPVVEAPEEVLRRRELVPFAAGVRAGAVAVMTSHVVLRALDPDRPATFSPVALGLLRAAPAEGGLGFDGLVVSDALEMRGASGEIGLPAAAVRALAAGVDLLCLGAAIDDGHVQAVEDAVVTAVEDGSLALGRLVEAAARVDTARRRLAALRAAADPGPDSDSWAGGASAEAARRGIVVVGNLPDLAHAQVLRLVTEANQAVGRAPWGLPLDGGLLGGIPARDVADGDTVPPLDPNRPVVALVRAGHRYAWVRHLLAELAAEHPDLVTVELGWPGPERLPGRAVVLSHGASAASAQAVDRLLTGATG
jgi:beta-N-acetylhexosaminidase